MSNSVDIKSLCNIVLESETTGKWPQTQVPHRHSLYPVATCSQSCSWLHWWWSPCYGLNWVELRACMSHQRQDERVWGGLITTSLQHWTHSWNSMLKINMMKRKKASTQWRCGSFVVNIWLWSSASLCPSVIKRTSPETLNLLLCTDIYSSKNNNN